MEKDTVLNEFLRRLNEDRSAGLDRPLDDYLAQFPDDVEVIRAEWKSIHGEGARGATQPEIPCIDLGPGGQVGPYRLVEELGRGGQGVVFLAEDERLKRRVALKVLTRWGSLSKEGVARFRREAELGARLDHPGICTVHDAGEHAGLLYIAMKLVEGRSLASVLARARDDAGDAHEDEAGRATGLETVLRSGDVGPILQFAERAARALASAHAQGVVHRDVKPGNILVTEDGHPVLVDFGLARRVDEASAVLTRTDALVGTPAYVAPEALTHDRRPPDERADVYALGAVLYECLTLRRPHEAVHRDALFRAILEDDPADPRLLRPGLSKDVRTLLERALQKDPSRRYASAADFAADLERLRRGEPIRARAVSRFERAVRWVRRRPGRTALIGSVLLVAVVVGFFLARWPEVRDAREAARRARIEERLTEGWLRLGEQFVEAAERIFVEVLEADPSSEAALVGRAITLLEREDVQGAIAVLQSRPDLVENSPVTALFLVDLRRSMGEDLEQPPEVVRRSGLDWFLAGRLYSAHARRGRILWDEAVDSLRAAILHPDKDQPYYYFALAEAVGNTDDEPAARQVADLILSSWKESPLARYWAGRAIESCDPEKALALFEASSAANPEFASARIRAAAMCVELGRFDDAMAWLDAAEALRPGEFATLRGRLQILDRQGRFEEALDLVHRHEKEHGRRLQPLVGRLYLRMDRPKEALPHLEEAVRRNPRFWNAHAQLGQAHARLGHFRRALGCFQRAVTLENRASRVLGDLGVSLLAVRHDQAALGALSRAYRLDPDLHVAARRHLFRALMLTGDVDGAADIARTLPKNKGNERALLARARWIVAHLDVGREPKLESALDRTLHATLLEARKDYAGATVSWLAARRPFSHSPLSRPRVRAALCLLRDDGAAESRLARAGGWLRAEIARARKRVGDGEKGAATAYHVLLFGLASDRAVRARRALLGGLLEEIEAELEKLVPSAQ